jgi:hypothetical protein
MNTIEAIIDRASDGDGYTVLTRVDGNNPWGVGVNFPTWAGARTVAVTILNATNTTRIAVRTKLTDRTARPTEETP